MSLVWRRHQTGGEVGHPAWSLAIPLQARSCGGSPGRGPLTGAASPKLPPGRHFEPVASFPAPLHLDICPAPPTVSARLTEGRLPEAAFAKDCLRRAGRKRRQKQRGKRIRFHHPTSLL